MARKDRTGITPIHRKGCDKKGLERCSCNPSFRAEAWDSGAQKRLYKTFPTFDAAHNWRQDTRVALRNGTVRAAEGITVAVACDRLVAGIEAGKVKANGGTKYKPSAARAIEEHVRLRIKPRLGGAKLRDIQLRHVQDLIDSMSSEGSAPSTVRNTVNSFRVVCKWARRRGFIMVNPCDDVELPSGEIARDRIVTPAQAICLVDALQAPTLRALFATAFFAGLRRGELLALDWENVDLNGRMIKVDRSYDPGAREFVAPKSKNGHREVPFPKQLLPHLMAIRKAEGLVFTAKRGGIYTHALKDAHKAWDEPIGLHEARHTYASHMLAAGVDIVRVSKWMGHSSIQITVDRYGHLVPGDEHEILERYEAYLSA